MYTNKILRKTMGLRRSCLLSCPCSSKQAMYTLAATTLGVDPSRYHHRICFMSIQAIKSCFSQADKFLCLMDATATNYLKLRDAGAYVEALEGHYKTVNKQMNSIHRMIQCVVITKHSLTNGVV
ncbi:hypothetical protein NC651_028870 [Populus alba x Populus x berolinensis]|nr:hypothetical protein NC651_028870 [Populus alba x Populus x berolinensis]